MLFRSSITAVGGYEIHEENREIAKTQRLEILRWLFLITFSMKRFRRYLATVTVVSPEQQLKFYDMATLFTRKSMRVMSGFKSIIQPREHYRLGKPLLLICGEHDLEIAIKASARWHGKETQSRFDIISDAGHCANMDQPEAFNSIVLEFLTSSTLLNGGKSKDSRIGMD